jgi:hypothetical protein
MGKTLTISVEVFAALAGEIFTMAEPSRAGKKRVSAKLLRRW